MKRNLIILLLLLFSIQFNNCSDQITSPELKFRHTADNFNIAVRVNDSTIIRANQEISSSKNNVDLRYEWATDFGTIKGSGEYAVFMAPNKNGTASVEVTVYDQNSVSFKQVYEIQIYKQFVILKADDFTYDSYYLITPRWRKFLNFTMENDLRAGLGLVGKSLADANFIFDIYLKEIINSGYFELWNHGYSHQLSAIDEHGNKYHEYWNTSFEDQYEHLLKTQRVALERLGIELKTFNSPGNAYDDNTVKALNEIDEIEVWIFGSNESNKFTISERLEMEFPVNNPDYNSFLQNYEPDRECVVFQLHPNSWNNEKFDEFAKVIDFLKRANVTFVTPYRYYEYMKKNN